MFDVSLHTNIHTYIHKYSDFLVVLISVGLAQARPNYYYYHIHTLSHDTHSCEVAVVKELLTLHSQTDSHSSILHTARLSTQLSTLCRSCHAYATCSHAPCKAPLALLDDAVALLEPLVTSLPPSHTHTLTHAHQHLATAHLWKALCTLEQNIG